MNREAATTTVVRVLDASSSRPVAGVRVEAWDIDDACGDLVAVGQTDVRGEFQITLADAYQRSLFGERRPALFFRVFQGERLVADTRDGVRWDPRNRSERLRLCVNLAHPPASDRRPAPLVVQGRVEHGTNGPLARVLVRAFDRNLAPEGFFEDRIGEVQTDALGAYRIEYRLGEHAPDTKMTADLMVRAFDATGMALGERFVPQAPATATVHLTIAGEAWPGVSEYEDLIERIRPALAQRPGGAAALDDDAVLFVAGSTGLDEERVRLLRDATRLGRETDLPAEVFYGLGRVRALGERRASLAIHPTASVERALRDAFDRNLIPGRFRAELGSIASRLSDALLARALVPSEGEEPSPGSILATSLVPEQLGRDFAAAAVVHRGDPGEFWRSLSGDPRFGEPGVIDDLRLTLQIAVLTQHHLPVMAQLRELRRTSQVRTLRDLAALSENDWRRLLERTAVNGQIPLPPHIRGGKPEDRLQNYLAGIVEPLRAAFPTDNVRRAVARAPHIDAALVRKLLAANPDLDPRRPLPSNVSWQGISEAERDRAPAEWRTLTAEVRAFPAWRWRDTLATGGAPANPIRDGVAAILERAPDLDLGTTNLDRYLAGNPTLLDGVLESDRDDVVRQLKAVQRVFRVLVAGEKVVPRGDHVTALLGAGLRSARSIARMGRNRFVARFAPIFGGEARAFQAYSQAVHYAKSIDAAYASWQADSAIAPYATDAPPHPSPPEAAESPEAVFGPLSTCACEPCQSVYSPSAYFVDLLHQLDPIDWDGVTPADVLFERRPDLPNIPITCENAFTPLPYIDVVNEVLEAYVQEHYGAGEPPPFDTGGVSAEELAAVPQHVNDAAYEVLRGTVYPPALPFDRPLEVSRAHLGQLGVGRYELLETFRRGPTPTEDDLAAEALGMSPAEYAIVAGSPIDPPVSTPEFYGYAPNDTTWLDDIAKAPNFLRRTGLRYEDLVELIKTSFVNRHQSDLLQRITLASPPDCDLADTKITPLPIEALERAHRFVRLWRKVGWSMTDVDRALLSFGATEIDAPVLRKLASVKQLAADLRLPVVRALALWARIDTWGRDALYFQLFDNPAIPKPGPNEPEWPEIQLPFNDDPDIKDANSLPEIAPGATLGDFLPAVRAALGVSADDLALILQHAGFSESAPLDVANVSALYRRALLARALRLRVRDLLSLLALGAPDPFQPGPENTNAFVRLVYRIRASRFSVPELEYLYRHRMEPGRTSGPTDERIKESVNKIRDELKQAEADAKTAIEETAETPAEAAAALQEVRKGAVARAVAQDLRLEDRVARLLLLGDALSNMNPAVSGALEEFLTEPTDPDPAYEKYLRLHKAALLVKGFSLSERDVKQLALNVDDLPVAEVGTPQATLGAWIALDDYTALRHSLPDDEDHNIVRLLGAEPSAAGIADATGWNETDVDALVGSSGFAFTGSDFDDVAKLTQLASCVTVARSIGVAAAKLLDWTSSWPNAGQENEIVGAVRAREPQHDAWLAVAKKVNDPLREQQRDALVAFLVPRLGVDSPNDLFGRFLIDVEMSACMPTSRIVQAIASVQLFVQRALLGHDPDIDAKVMAQAIDPESWKWRKNYRVWEANRKVFLYPENWIEPELRADKSPFFRELETDLLKGEPTEENLERAVKTYLDKLLDVARVDLISMYWQEDADADLLHVFGRTPSPPYQYYYRQLHNRREWTAWEQVPLDLPTMTRGAHLVPVVHNRRLYLFWPVFTDASSVSSSLGSLPATGDEISDKWKIGLHWSEYRSGRWSPKRTSSSEITFDEVLYQMVSHYGLRAVTAGEGVEIRVFVQGPQSDPSKFPVVSFCLDECAGAIVVRDGTTPAPITEPGFAFVLYMTFGIYGGHEELSFVGKDSTVRTVLESIPVSDGMNSRVVYPHQIESAALPDAFREFFYPFFLQDSRRTYYALPSGGEAATPHGGLLQALNKVDVTAALSMTYRNLPLNGLGAEPIQAEASPVEATPKPSWLNSVLKIQLAHFERLRFASFWHPYVCDFVKSVESHGLSGVFTLANQNLRADSKDQPGSFFLNHYNPTTWVDLEHLPTYVVDFSQDGAYSLYNWELFFHVPFLVACHLSRNQRYEEAQQWFHYVFDPRTDPDEPPQKAFWRVRPLRDVGPTLSAHELMELLAYTKNEAETLARKREVEDQIAQWEAHPFQPHRIARLRLSAYKKAVVRRYLDNLIAWADSLFARHTRESIQEATQLYLLAAGILGPRPERIPAKATVEPKTFQQMREALDDFSNFVTAENVVFPFASSQPGDGAGESVLGPNETLYFCTPPNDHLLTYWDNVQDRLFKIRHCMGIEGVVRPLALFEPPIDPALLVRATAAGVDIQSVLAELFAPRPHHRFVHLVQRAVEFCGEVRTFGAAMLAALEKQDGEALAALRATHEMTLLEAIRQVRQRQMDEATEQRAALERTREVTNRRFEFYRDIEPRIQQERDQKLSLEAAEAKNADRRSNERIASWLAAIPDLTVTVPPSTTFGGSHLGGIYRAIAGESAATAERFTYLASMSSLEGSWARRQEEWTFRRDDESRQLTQIDRQIAAHLIGEDIARRELENHELQIEQSITTRDFLRDKFTNADLYGWMLSETGALYYQAYKLAFELARRAERAFQFERGLGPADSSFIQFGYWDSLRKGLLAGEKLALDLRRLEMAYMEQNRREYEITRHVSLVLHDPMALVSLKEKGFCEVELPEQLWDSDYPGHYFRRIKNVSVTIPCVVGPYTSVNCTLTMLSNRIRTSPDLNGGYREKPDDTRFLPDFAAVQSIATSQAQNDAGLFELNFRDERYLPFEGAGVISRWRIELPQETNAFDFETISDVVLRIAYTAREGGTPFRDAARDARDLLLETLPSDPNAPIPPLRRLFSARHEFPDAWHRFLHPQPNVPQTLELSLGPERFPYLLRGRQIHITRVELYLKPKEGEQPDISELMLELPDQPEPQPMKIGADPDIPLAHAWLAETSPDQAPLDEAPGTWTLRVAAPGPPALTPVNTRDLVLVLTYYATKHSQ
jgi:hypothetical protein